MDGIPELSAAFRLPRGAGFTELLGHLGRSPDLTGAPAGGVGPGSVPDALAAVPHGTTIVALTFGGGAATELPAGHTAADASTPDGPTAADAAADAPAGAPAPVAGSPGTGGVVMAGDRRATAGNFISKRDIEKVFPADDHSVVGIAGTAGLAIELVRLFRVELEHYEKIEGAQLSLDGKANRLSQMVRNNLGLAMQGLGVVPLFAGYDLDAGRGRIFSYDVTGGRYEETGFTSVGSGSMFARGALKKLYAPELGEADCVTAVVEALFDAADDDSATGGPDIYRRIWPVVAVVGAGGYRRLGEDEVGAVVERVLRARHDRPDGPRAAVSS